MNKITNLTCTIALIYLSFYCQAQEGSTYPDSIQTRINQVESGLTEWGKTHYEFPTFTLKELMEMKNVPGLSIAVINNYQIEWAKGYGFADNKEKTRVTTETAFNAASMSKSINAIGFLKLAESGKIDLNEDINQYLSSWKFTYTMKKPITTYQLLSHTAGLSHNPVRLINKYRKQPSVIEMFKKRGKDYITSKYNPGLRFSYSNSAISISQLILNDITQLPYGQNMKEMVFRPLGMSNSFYLDRQNESSYQLASGHWKEGKRITHYHPRVAELAPSGLWTTPTDLAKFVIELQLSLKGKSNKVLSKQSVELMLTPARQELPHNYIIYGGLGSFIENKNGVNYFQHAGLGLGFSGVFYGSYEEGQGVVVMINSNNISVRTAIVNKVAAVYKWKNFLFNNGNSIDNVDVSDEVMSKYLGKYKSVDDPLNKMEITIKDNLLHVQLSGGDGWFLDFIPITQSTFWAENIPNTTMLEFQVNENGVATTLTLSNGYKTSSWVRIEGNNK